MSWTQRDGYEWQIVPTADPGAVTLGATLGYGLLDESAVDFGTLRTLVGLLRVELARPVELAGGGGSVPEAFVDVAPDVITLTMRGPRDVVVSGWRRVATFLASPVRPDPVTPAPVDEFGWPRDANVRCGLNAFTLTMAAIPLPSVPVERLDQLRQHLDPVQGRVRCVFFTTDESTVSSFFAAPPPTTAALPSAGSRGQGSNTAANLRSIPGPVAFTVVVPRTWAGLAAAVVVRDHFARSLYSVTGSIPSIGFTEHQLGADRWIHVVSGELPAAPDRIRAITTTLTTPVPDAVIDAAVAEVNGADDTRHERERRALGLGSDVRPDESQVRAAVIAALQTVHVPAESPAQEVGDFPELLGALPAESGKQFHAWMVQRDVADSGAPAYVSVGPRVLSRPLSGTSDEVDTTDLTDAVLVLERGDGLVSVMDSRMRMVGLRPESFRNGRALRRLLDERTAGVPRLSLPAPEDDRYAAELSSRVASGRRRTVVAFSVLGVFLAFLVIMIVVQRLA